MRDELYERLSVLGNHDGIAGVCNLIEPNTSL
jgi:hypothetical protein